MLAFNYSIDTLVYTLPRPLVLPYFSHLAAQPVQFAAHCGAAVALLAHSQRAC